MKSNITIMVFYSRGTSTLRTAVWLAVEKADLVMSACNAMIASQGYLCLGRYTSGVVWGYVESSGSQVTQLNSTDSTEKYNLWFD